MRAMRWIGALSSRSPGADVKRPKTARREHPAHRGPEDLTPRIAGRPAAQGRRHRRRAVRDREGHGRRVAFPPSEETCRSRCPSFEEPVGLDVGCLWRRHGSFGSWVLGRHLYVERGGIGSWAASV